MKVLQINTIHPEQRIKKVLDHFDQLKEGEHFQIIHDVNPRPLLIALKSNRGSTVHWKYIDQGTHEWSIEIQKLPDINKVMPVGKLVNDDLRKAEVFIRFDIDFACRGDVLLGEICEDLEIDMDLLMDELSQIDKTPNNELHDYKSWPISFLADYIKLVYHRYERKLFPGLNQLAGKVYRVHGEQKPSLKDIFHAVREIAVEVNKLLDIEANIVFPQLQDLSNRSEREKSSSSGVDDLVNNTWELQTRDSQSEIMAGIFKLRKQSDDYKIPEDACTAYRQLFNDLRDFDKNINIHIHLVNNILIPNARKEATEPQSEFIELKQHQS